MSADLGEANALTSNRDKKKETGFQSIIEIRRNQDAFYALN